VHPPSAALRNHDLDGDQFFSQLNQGDNDDEPWGGSVLGGRGNTTGLKPLSKHCQERCGR
jgi:hypothetical protein